MKYCKNTAEAEDNLHDVFVTIFQQIKTYKGKGSFEGWMKRIAIFKGIDKYKANKEIPIAINDNILEDSLIATQDVDLPLEDILRLIQELPDQYRLVFNMYQLDGYSHKEIASHLGISVGTSKSNYHRAKALLKDRITKSNISHIY